MSTEVCEISGVKWFVKRPLVFEEIQQIGHLLKIGRYVRIVPAQMDVVELNVNDVLDAIFEAAAVLPQITVIRPVSFVLSRNAVLALGGACRLAQRGRKHRRGREKGK
jgi:hypothetical protein